MKAGPVMAARWQNNPDERSKMFSEWQEMGGNDTATSALEEKLSRELVPLQACTIGLLVV